MDAHGYGNVAHIGGNVDSYFPFVRTGLGSPNPVLPDHTDNG